MLCFRKIPAAKSIWIRVGGVSRFSAEVSKFFRLTVPKNAVGEPFSHTLISGIEKVCMRGWGGGCVKVFRRKILVSQCPKTPLVNLLVIHYFRLWRKFG